MPPRRPASGTARSRPRTPTRRWRIRSRSCTSAPTTPGRPRSRSRSTTGPTWPRFTPANTYPGLTEKTGAAPGEPEIYRPLGFVNYFRPIPADDIQGAVAAKWAKRLGVKKVFILNDQELYG